MISALYKNLPDNIEKLLTRSMAKGLANGSGEAMLRVRVRLQWRCVYALEFHSFHFTSS